MATPRLNPGPLPNHNLYTKHCTTGGAATDWQTWDTRRDHAWVYFHRPLWTHCLIISCLWGAAWVVEEPLVCNPSQTRNDHAWVYFFGTVWDQTDRSHPMFERQRYQSGTLKGQEQTTYWANNQPRCRATACSLLVPFYHLSTPRYHGERVQEAGTPARYMELGMYACF